MSDLISAKTVKEEYKNENEMYKDINIKCVSPNNKYIYKHHVKRKTDILLVTLTKLRIKL